MMLLFEIPIFFYSIARGWFLFKIKSYFYIINNLGKIMKKRASVQNLRKIDDKEIVKGFTPEISFAQESGKLSRFASYFLKSYWLLIKNHF